ncbi:hypothetical protein HYX01_00365 [Candidatus Woesearchaeota archaeon]|nr:hypothetical protein [Candidatus Woesearchaeota archaeon]
MQKIHTAIKRRLGLSRRRSHYYFFHFGTKKRRPKTFKTEKAANEWAIKNGLKPEQYALKKVKKEKRFQVVRAIQSNK